jgi:radical SAM protein with 4Fe4S-binding SPASM domain
VGTFETGRSGSLLKYYKDEGVKDVMRSYFSHPIWAMKAGEPVPDMPLDVQIELVNRCNLHCSACGHDDQRRARTVLEWPVLERIVDEAAVEGVCYFTVCGLGEATLHRDCFRFFGHARRRKVEPKGLRTLPMMPTVLISNGMWSTAQIDACLENPPDLVSFSLAGLTDDEILDRRGGIDLARFEHVVSRLYKERRVVRAIDGGRSPTIHVSTHIYPHEMVQRKADVEAFKERWFRMADVVVIKPTMLSKARPIVSAFARNQAEIGDSQLRYSDLSEVHFERTAPCFETSRRLSINSDGEVWCGHHMSEDFGPFLGNVKTQSLKDIWHGEAMNRFRIEVRAGRFEREACRKCGGEIRDFHRDKEVRLEPKITFGASA